MPRRRKPPDPNSVMFRLLPPMLKTELRGLSLKGLVYIGRTGYGFTTSLQKALMREGSVKVLEREGAYCNDLQKRILDFALMEGSKWASYALLQEWLKTPGEGS